MPKSQRIRTQVGVDKAIQVQLDQDFETLNILSLKILKSDIYNRQCSDYGVVVGRVFVNGGFGLANARVSVFIPISNEDSLNPIITELYPYTSLSDLDADGYRYNLLPKNPSYDGHAATGTFPDRSDALLDESYIEVYDKYYKFTTRTNDSGDYMIFGVPLGSQTIFMDVDLSDIGCFSLAPQDLIQAGQAVESQVNGSKFKSSTNLNELPQVKTLNKIIDISPLWGEPEICQLGITRADFDLTAEANISIEPTAVFMGSIISTTDDDALRASCRPKNNTGNLCELVSGPGQILSIRQTINVDDDGLPILEQFNLDNNGKVIDGDGAYLVNLPMNLDYVFTNEFGEQTLSTDPTIGIPTKARYRFKFKWENEGGLQNEFLRANFLVPNIKEFGWDTANVSYNNDPLKIGQSQTVPFIIPAQVNSTFQSVPGPGSLINPVLTNVDSYQVYVSSTGTLSGLQPYYGNLSNGITGLTTTNGILIQFVQTDPTLPSSVSFTGVGGCPNTTFSIVGNQISDTITIGPNGGGLVFDEVINVSSYSVEINGIPYFGDTQVIPTNPGDIVTITPVFTDPLTQAEVIYTLYSENYFDLLRSYTFSLDWDDYVDPQSAIDCEDTFYEFHYNKVYTTAAFIDRYKNGIGRAKHLGIKEIDNRTCKSTVNTFPVNDVIRNFDFIFFITNLLFNILQFPILVLLFIAHLIALIWPILKWLLIALGLYFVVQAGSAVYETATEIAAIVNEIAGLFSFGAGAVFNLTNLLEALRLALKVVVLVIKAIFIVGLSLAFLALAIFAALKVKGFPRIGLPMITYPDCSTCDCACGEAPMSDDFDSDSINSAIEEEGSANADVELPQGIPNQISKQTSIFAPINNLSTFVNLEHPNINQPLNDDDEPERCFGNFWFPGTDNNCGADGDGTQYKSFLNQAWEQRVNGQIGIPAGLGFLRLLTGSESLDPASPQNYTTGIPGSRRLHAPQPFVFAPQRRAKNNDTAESFRFLAHPTSEAYSQKLNEFNYRSKFFDGVNKIKVKFNYPTNTASSQEHYDQPLVILAKPGTLQNLGIGEIFTFQDPNLSQCNQNLTGATFFSATTNQFNNNSVTGTSYSALTKVVTYATSYGGNGSVPYVITGDTTENYLKYPVDIEYFQVITGFTYNEFIANTGYNGSTLGFFPQKYLHHKAGFIYANGSNSFPYLSDLYNTIKTFKGIENTTHLDPLTQQKSTVIFQAEGYQEYEIIVITRGVDPHSPKQKNRYDLSVIFGQTTTNNSVVIEGDYYLNIPIQGLTGVGNRPTTHNVISNDTATELFFEPFNFKLGESYTIGGVDYNKFTTFQSRLPHYYSSIDEGVAPFNSYTPDAGFPTVNQVGSPNGGGYDTIGYGGPNWRGFLLPIDNGLTPPPILGQNNNTSLYYFAGGSFTMSNVGNSSTVMYGDLGQDQDRENDYWKSTAPRLFSVYSPAYYRYSIPSVTFNVDQTPGQPQYMVMRSDRVPTSTGVEENYGTTSYGLHQNNNFRVYKAGVESGEVYGFEPDINGGQGVYDESALVQSLTSTLSCENMKSLQCYVGTGASIEINPNCSVPDNRVYRGCYCLLNYKESDNKFFKKLYLIQGAFKDDARLFLEWKTRFLVTFAACKGVFAQTFQNNWINGVLYMFSFNKSTFYELDQPDEPRYVYCQDTIIFNEITNSFFYRSSPWNKTTNQFVGSASPTPPNAPAYLLNDYPGLGYNTRRIQFPTTIMDLGPREKFISQICSDSEFNGYLVDQMRATSYKDNSDLIQMGFISRLLNQTFIQQLLPVGDPAGNSSEGKGIIQFFNSERKGDRIDGDIAQALAINSEWKVIPYLGENYPDNALFIGDSTSPSRPLFGIFFSSSTEDYSYRRKLTPGYEYYSLNCGGVFNDFGYPKDQVVPHYKWRLAPQGDQTNFIFGTENNNWDTLSAPGFYKNEYQNLNFDAPNQYFTTTTPNNLGFITNFDSNGDPEPTYAGVTNGLEGEKVLVGAPFYFYFGLNNGFTALDKFIKLYIETTD